MPIVTGDVFNRLAPITSAILRKKWRIHFFFQFHVLYKSARKIAMKVKIFFLPSGRTPKLQDANSADAASRCKVCRLRPLLQRETEMPSFAKTNLQECSLTCDSTQSRIRDTSKFLLSTLSHPSSRHRVSVHNALRSPESCCSLLIACSSGKFWTGMELMHGHCCLIGASC